MEGSVGDVGRHRVVKPVWGHAEHVRRLMYRYTPREHSSAETGTRNMADTTGMNFSTPLPIRPPTSHAEHVRSLMYRFTRLQPSSAETGSRNMAEKMRETIF